MRGDQLRLHDLLCYGGRSGKKYLNLIPKGRSEICGLCVFNALIFAAKDLMIKELIVAIFIIYFYALNVWANTLSHQTDSIAFALFIALPALPGIPIAIWYFMANRSPSLFNRTQQLLRASAGPDELLVRELERRDSSGSEPNNSG